jgi:hypothetical protein
VQRAAGGVEVVVPIAGVDPVWVVDGDHHLGEGGEDGPCGVLVVGVNVVGIVGDHDIGSWLGEQVSDGAYGQLIEWA